MVPVPDDTAIHASLQRGHALDIVGERGDIAGWVWRISVMGRSATRAPVELATRALANMIASQRNPGLQASTA